MPDQNELVAILEEVAGVSESEALQLLNSNDRIVQRQIQAVIDSVSTQPEFDAVLARHRARFGRRKEPV
jgi:hypothetical protein